MTRRAPTPRTLAAVARILGRTRGTVTRWTQRPDWPFSRRPPWPLEQVRAWAAAIQANNPALGGPGESAAPQSLGSLSILSKARVALLIEQREKTKTERLVLQSKYHPVADCTQRRIEQIQLLKMSLLDLAHSIAPALVGLSRDEIEHSLTASVRQFLTDFAAGLEPVPAPILSQGAQP